VNQRADERSARSSGPLTGPVRSCVVCRGKGERGELLRMVADEAGRLRLDPRRILPGRGAWVHPSSGCVQGLSRRPDALGRALRRKVVLGAATLDALAQRIPVAGAADRVENRKGNEES